MKTLNILVVEDTELHQEAARVQLAAHNLTIAPDFVSFQEEWKKGGWDVVLTDLNFPLSLDRDGASSNGIPHDQPQPIGAIVVLMAQAVGVPVRMLSAHGDTVNYPLEHMGLVLNECDWPVVVRNTLLPLCDEDSEKRLSSKAQTSRFLSNQIQEHKSNGIPVCNLLSTYENRDLVSVKGWKVALEQFKL